MSIKDRTKRIMPIAQVVGAVRTINAQSIRVREVDENGYVTRCSGTVSITNGGAGYAKGCLYVKTNVAAGTSGLYKNIGDTSACEFTVIT